MEHKHNGPDRATMLRQLELVDRIVGLEAEISRLKDERAISDIRLVQQSLSWKIGNFFLYPLKKFLK